MAEKKYTAAQRRKAAKKGAARPDGSFPIETPADLARAKHAVGRAKNPAAAKAHINRRAKALGKPGVGKKKPK
jgi:hypothetical protein